MAVRRRGERVAGDHPARDRRGRIPAGRSLALVVPAALVLMTCACAGLDERRTVGTDVLGGDVEVVDAPLGPTVTDPAGAVAAWSWMSEPRPTGADGRAEVAVLGGRDPSATEVVLQWYGSPCEGSPDVYVLAEPDRLRFDVDAGPVTDPDCEDLAEPYWLRVELAEPVGDRVVVLELTGFGGWTERWSSGPPPAG